MYYCGLLNQTNPRRLGERKVNMRKLMATAVISAFGAAVAFGGIVSSDVVGYTSNNASSGNQAAGTCFIPVSGEGKMSDVVVTGYTGEYLDGQIYCGKLDNYGRTITRMYWLDSEEYTDPDTSEHWDAQYGWWDADGEVEYNDVSLSAGEGLWMTFPSTTYKVQTSGKVISESLPVTLVAGNQLLSNPTPVTLKMGQVWVTGYTGEYLDGQIYCGKLDNYGRTITRMYWLDSEEYTDPDTSEHWDAQYGWWDADGEVEYNNTETLAPGQAVWFTSPSAAYTLNWPNPLAD